MLIDTYNYRALEGKRFNPRAHFVRTLPLSMHVAELAAEEADSYRGVNVGLAFQALNAAEGLLGTFVTWNDKPFKDLRKRCAETKAWLEARDTGYTYPIGQVLYGPDDPEIVAGIVPQGSHALLTCGECLHVGYWYTQEGRLRISNHMPTLAIAGKSGRGQVFSQAEQMALQGYDDSHPLPPEHVFEGLHEAEWGEVERAYDELAAVRGLHEAARLRGALGAALAA